MSTHPLTRDIVPGADRLGTPLVNWYLVEEGGRLTAVDAGLPGYRKTLVSELSQLGHVPGDIDAVVLTHADVDHIGLVKSLRGRAHLADTHIDRRKQADRRAALPSAPTFLKIHARLELPG